MNINLKLQSARSAAFADFGQLLERPATAPDIAVPEFQWWGGLLEAEMEGISVGLVRAVDTGDRRQKTLEQHLHTREMLIPLGQDVILVLGKPGAFAGAPKAGDFAAFRVESGCAAALHKGVWHQAPMVLDGAADTLVIFQKNTGERDKIQLDMAEQGLTIRLDEA